MDTTTDLSAQVGRLARTNSLTQGWTPCVRGWLARQVALSLGRSGCQALDLSAQTQIERARFAECFRLSSAHKARRAVTKWFREELP